jgi:hypothetical protein
MVLVCELFSYVPVFAELLTSASLLQREISDIFKDEYTGCNRRNGPKFGRVFLMLNYTDITQNTYVQS